MPKTILIQDPDVLISLDLAQTVMEAWPDASVILCRDVPQSVAVLSDGQGPDLAVMRQSIRSLNGYGLLDLLRRSAAQVLLTGADPEDAAAIRAAGWRALDMPFRATQVRGALLDAFPGTSPAAESHCNVVSVR